MSEDADAAEEALAAAKSQSRMDAEPDTPEEPGDLAGAVADALAAIDDGDVSSNLTIRDDDLAALFVALDETGELEDVVEAAGDVLGKEDVSVSRSRALALLVRVGLREVEAPLAAFEDGKRAYLDTRVEDSI